jgi:hypothetical protein
MSGSFILFFFGMKRPVNTVFVENLTSSQHLEKEDEMRGYTLVFGALRSAAVSTAASVARIRTHLRGRLGAEHPWTNTGANCVETARTHSGAVAARNRKSPGSGELVFSTADRAGFVSAIKADEFSPR